MDLLANELAEHFHWGGEANGAAFLLCDTPIIVNPVHVPSLTEHYVTMRVHVDATVDEVADAYRQAREMIGVAAEGVRAKSLGERTLRAAGFAALRWQREWPDIYGEWCRHRPGDDGYADWRAFRRAALTGLRAL